MNEEIYYITNEGKMPRNIWKNDDCSIHCSFASYKYFKKLISEVLKLCS